MDPRGGPEQIPLQLLEYRDVLFAYILTQVREWDAAEDIFQEVSLTILKKSQEKIEVTSFKAWSREIARRTILDYRKKRGAPVAALSSDALESLERIFGAHEQLSTEQQREILAHLQECLKALPEKLLRMVNLRYQEDLSLEQVAERSQMTAGAAQVALSRARAALAECIRRKSQQDGHNSWLPSEGSA